MITSNRNVTVAEYQRHKREVDKQRQQIQTDFRMRFEVLATGQTNKESWNNQQVRSFRVTLTNEVAAKAMQIDFFQGMGHRTPPKPFDVLHCIRMDDPQGESFEYWCDDFGFDTDSRKALETYLQCQKQADDFRRVFPACDLQEYEPLQDY